MSFSFCSLPHTQVADVSASRSMDKTVSRCSAALAAVGLALSSFGLKQMLNTRGRRC